MIELLKRKLAFHVDNSKGPNACWPWRSYKMPKGYGQMGWITGTQLAHRLAYVAAHGLMNHRGDLLISPKQLVLHDCDNPPCCNPRHLHLGDKKKNAQEAIERGLLIPRVGEATGSAKLTEKQVLAIRKDCRSVREIAKNYGVGKTIIGSIKRREKWKHLPN